MAAGKPLPSPWFNDSPSKDASKPKANPWIEVMNERFRTNQRHHDSALSTWKHSKSPNPSHRFLLSQSKHYNPNQQGRNYEANSLDYEDDPSHKRSKIMDKRDRAENNQYFCDSCDRGFPTSEKYHSHVNEHQTCREPGCKYIAAPKLVQLHYKLQHLTGLAKRIKESDEDIETWIAERKRGFPTKANIERKRQLDAEKIERGEVLENQQFGRMRGRGRGRGRGQGRGRGRGQGRFNSPRQQHRYHENQPAMRFGEDYVADPLSYLENRYVDDRVNYVKQDVTEIRILSPEKKNPADHKPVSTNHNSTKNTASSNSVGGLGNLMSNYADSSEEEGEIKDDDDEGSAHNGNTTPQVNTQSVDTNGKTTPQLHTSQKSTAPSNNNNTFTGSITGPTNSNERYRASTAANESSSQSKSVHDENNHAADSKAENVDQKSHQNVKERKPRHGNKNKAQFNKRQHDQRRQKDINFSTSKSTLLQKLLANEMRHERNVLLQCVRHVVKSEFFGAADTTSNSLNTHSDDEW